MIKIFTDSTAYIPKSLIEEYDISVIPVMLKINGEEYLENELANALFYELMEQTDTIPEVITPDAEYIEEKFREQTNKGNVVAGIFMSAKLSGLFSNAQKAKEKIQSENTDAKIYPIDSEANGMQMGLAVLAAADINKQGQWMENVVNEAYKVMQRTRYLFIPGKLKYVGRGGNLDKGRAMMGDLVHLCPVMSSIKGKMEPMDTVHTHKKAVDRMIGIMDEDIKLYNISQIVVVHIHAKDKADELKERLKGRTEKEIIVSQIGASVGYHIGPGTLGIVYQTEDIHPLNEHIKPPKYLV